MSKSALSSEKSVVAPVVTVSLVPDSVTPVLSGSPEVPWVAPVARYSDSVVPVRSTVRRFNAVYGPLPQSDYVSVKDSTPVRFA